MVERWNLLRRVAGPWRCRLPRLRDDDGRRLSCFSTSETVSDSFTSDESTFRSFLAFLTRCNSPKTNIQRYYSVEAFLMIVKLSQVHAAAFLLLASGL